MKKEAVVSRKTKETDIRVAIFVDTISGEKPIVQINSGVGFFDHMLTALAVHSGISLELSCKGDLNVDCHHTVEDCGIAIGMAFSQMLGDKGGIARYGSAYIPMDEALAFSAVDISGRPFLSFDAEFTFENIGDMASQMVEEFFRAFAFNAGITLHTRVIYGKNDHHKAEAIFKAVAHALSEALTPTREGEVLSTKGTL